MKTINAKGVLLAGLFAGIQAIGAVVAVLWVGAGSWSTYIQHDVQNDLYTLQKGWLISGRRTVTTPSLSYLNASGSRPLKTGSSVPADTVATLFPEQDHNYDMAIAVLDYECGWPFRVFRYRSVEFGRGRIESVGFTMKNDVVFPDKIGWIGLAGNMCIAAVAAGGTWLTARRLVRVYRRRRGVCITCGYPVSGLASAPCSECGSVASPFPASFPSWHRTADTGARPPERRSEHPPPPL